MKNKGTYIILLIGVYFITSCTITGKMNRRGYNTHLTHSTAQQREIIEKETAIFQRGYIEYTKADSTKAYILPNVTGDDGESMMQLDLNEVVVVARSRTLPERLGKVSIDFIVTLPKELQGNTQSIVITPVLHKTDEDVELEDLTIRGGLFNKVQQRNYWQYNSYKDRFKPDSVKNIWAYNRFIHYPFPEGTRLDSVIDNKTNIQYFYTQEINTSEAGTSLLITLKGKVVALDRSYYNLPVSDTLTYNISSVLNFVDTGTRYMTKIIEKYAVVNDRNYLSYRVNSAEIIDSLGNNQSEIQRIESLMDEIIRQNEFHIDSIILTSSASPEGTVRKNIQLSKERAASLRDHLVQKFPEIRLDTLITIRPIGEDWQELERMVKTDDLIIHKDEILLMIQNRSGKDHDKLEQEIKTSYPEDYKYMLESLYPNLRAVNFKYDLRRVNMVKDTIHTTVPDRIYAGGVSLLQNRKYNEALEILGGFCDRNTAICLLSLGYDKRAYYVLKDLPRNSTTLYLLAIACARIGDEKEALHCFDESVELNPGFEFRGNLDPELSTLLKKEKNMKKRNSSMLFVLILMLASCTVWEDKWEQRKELPEIEDQIEIEPWEENDDKQELY